MPFSRAGQLCPSRVKPLGWDRPALHRKLLDEERGLVDAGHPDDLFGDPLRHGAIRWIGQHRTRVRSHPLDGQLATLKAASRAGLSKRIGIATLARRRSGDRQDRDTVGERAERRPRATVAYHQRAVRQQRRLRNEPFDADAIGQ